MEHYCGLVKSCRVKILNVLPSVYQTNKFTGNVLDWQQFYLASFKIFCSENSSKLAYICFIISADAYYIKGCPKNATVSRHIPNRVYTK